MSPPPPLNPLGRGQPGYLTKRNEMDTDIGDNDCESVLYYLKGHSKVDSVNLDICKLHGENNASRGIELERIFGWVFTKVKNLVYKISKNLNIEILLIFLEMSALEWFLSKEF